MTDRYPTPPKNLMEFAHCFATDERCAVHHQANRCADEVIRHLCNDLNQTETIYPGTDLRLVYEFVSS